MTKANKKLTDNGTKLASQTSLQLLPLIMQNIPQAVFWKDQNLVYLGCNRAFAEDAGFASPEDVIGKTDFDMPWKDQAEAYRADDQRVLDGGEPKLNYEEPQTTPSGSTTWLSTSKIPVCEDGRVVAILGMYEDITERKESEDRFRRFTEATSEALIFHELGKIVDVNPAALVMFGFAKEADVIGMNLLEFVAPESRALVMEKMQLGDVPPYEAVCIRTDKTTFPIETTTRSYRFGNRLIRATTVRDITQRKRAQTQLQQEKSFSDAIINALPSTFYMFDIQGKMLRWNEQYEKESGYTAEDMQTISVIDTLAEDSRENALAAIQQALVEGQGAVEASFITKDGRSIPYYFAGRRLQIGDQTLLVGTGMNLTERKQAEAQLQQEKSLSDAIINGLPGTFYLFDTQGKLIRWNKQYEQVLGYTTEETAARNAIDPIAEEDRGNTTAAIQKTFVEGQGSVEASFVTKDGRRIPYYFVGQRIQLGDQLYLAGTGIDITERRKLEEQIQTAFERRGLQVQLSTQVSQSIASAASLEELYERVVTQVKEQFGYYHTQLLRYDEAQDAVVLVTGYGETGAKMLAAGHRMPMGEGLIGTAASTGETILRSDLANDPDWHPNPLLPETKGEIAVPIKLGNAILGVLDVQSSAAGALGADDQLLLEGLCGQIA
ncbi:MAG TPA: PAS domain S-box protein, partial [Anaerolineales bacterium]|nr:PAS domain S-box protein [Anaerolineales bacterium]